MGTNISGSGNELSHTEHPRGGFTSSIGFILAATGSAVGLGNLWKFPYVAGENGGAVFLIFYLLFSLVLGVPLFMAEMSIGRKTRLNPIGAYHKLNKKYTFIGVIGVISALVIMSYYSVIGGWVIKYIVTYVTNTNIGNAGEFYQKFITSSAEPVIFHLIFMAVTCFIVIKGIAKGIERASKIMLPTLFILIIIVVIRSLTLPNAIDGVKYFLVPNWSDINSFSKLAKVMLSAMGQVFFSLSLGMGAMITFGSYLSKDENLKKSAIIIPTLDTVIAMLAGFAILPAVFAFSFTPQAGEGLLFETLPQVFASMPFGDVFGLMFFVLVFFAAVTSSVSLLEVVTSFCIDNLKLNRKLATILVSAVIAIMGVFAALSYGALSDVKIFGMSIFQSLTFLSDKLLMPLGGLACCIFVGYVWGIDNAAVQITNEGALTFRSKKVFAIIMRYVAPLLIGIVFISGLLS